MAAEWVKCLPCKSECPTLMSHVKKNREVETGDMRRHKKHYGLRAQLTWQVPSPWEIYSDFSVFHWKEECAFVTLNQKLEMM